MSRKDRFAPKFSNSNVDSKYGYDDLIDKDLRELNARMGSMMHNAPAWRRQAWSAKAQKTIAKNRKKRLPDPKEREAAECRMIEAVRTAVSVLEHHMTALMQYPGRDATKPVNQLAVCNAIVTLKTKCGVKFDDSDFMEMVEIDRVHLMSKPLEPESGPEYEERMEWIEHQKRARLAAFGRLAERLKARPK